MPLLNIKIPAIKLSYYDTVAANANKKKIEEVIRPKYGKYINNIAKLSNVPSQLIESFIFIESAGNQNAQSPYAVGLMQVGLATASDAIVFEKGAGRLSSSEAAIIKKRLGTRYSMIEKVKPKQKSLGKTFITKDDLLDPEFNILIGTILMKQLIDEFTDKSGKVRMDKVVAIYNAGRYGSTSKKIIASKEPIDKIIKTVPKETNAYILKLLGERGVLDMIV